MLCEKKESQHNKKTLLQMEKRFFIMLIIR